jgi:hypothetical protein
MIKIGISNGIKKKFDIRQLGSFNFDNLLIDSLAIYNHLRQYFYIPQNNFWEP